MLTIKVFLAESGAIADLQKDFPLFQNQYQNVLLNAFVPVSLLAPNFTVNAENSNSVINPYVAGSAVKVGIRTIARNGEYNQSLAYYMRFVKITVKNGISYALFERRLPKEFATFAGQGINAPKLIFNVENVDFGEITGVSAVSSNPNLTVSANLAVAKANLPAISKNYEFIYSLANNCWYTNTETLTEVELINYGLTVVGVPADEDTITLSVISATPTVISVATTQTVSLDIMPSANFDSESLPADEYAEIMANINALLASLILKQDKTDTGLQTTNKTIVGAINELVQKYIFSEDYIGTYRFTATIANPLPTDNELLAYVKSERGNDYNLKSGDIVIVVAEYTGLTDKTYKYIYNGLAWIYYEIPSGEKAGNGFEGIVRGSYGTSDMDDGAFKVVLDVNGGAIQNIYIKQGALWKQITDAFWSEAQTRQFVKSYALPKEFNETMYFSNSGEFSTDAPSNPIIASKSINTIGDTLITTNEYVCNEAQFQLSKKNSCADYLYIQISSDSFPKTVSFIVNTFYVKENQAPVLIGSAQTIDFTWDNTSVKEVIVQMPFNQIPKNAVINVETGDKIRQDVYVRTTSSNNIEVVLLSTSGLYSRFYLFTNVAALVTSMVQQTTGDSVYDVMSQKAVTDELNKKQDKITATNKVSADFLENGTTNKVFTATDKNKLDSLIQVVVVQNTGNSQTTVMSQKAVTDELNKKQDKLVSSVNIKTLNGKSILEPGNLVVSANSFMHSVVLTATDGKITVIARYLSNSNTPITDLLAFYNFLASTDGELALLTSSFTFNDNSITTQGEYVLSYVRQNGNTIDLGRRTDTTNVASWQIGKNENEWDVYDTVTQMASISVS